jgi:hypothetical protein
MTLNEELIEFSYRFLEHPDDKELIYYFNKIKRLLKLHTYNDPAGVLQPCDIENLALIGFWNAILKFDENRWDNMFLWCYYLVKQNILREIGRIQKYNEPALTTVTFPELEIENQAKDIDTVLGVVEVPFGQKKDIQVFCLDLEERSLKASLAFQLKLAFPRMTRNSLAKILGFKRRSGLAKIVKIIRKRAKAVLDEELIQRS